MRRGRLLLGVSGSSAADAIPALVQEADVAGWEVQIVATPTAERFMPEVKVPVFTDTQWRTWPAPLHLELLRDIDAFLVAPATAQTIAATAHGLADNLLTALVISHRPTHFWPTMNSRMWTSPAVQRNIRLLTEYGHHVLTPGPSASLTADDPCAAVGPIPGTVLDGLTLCCHRP